MKIITKEQRASIFDLLMHDKQWSVPGVDNDHLEEALNEQLTNIRFGVFISKPDGLDRWIISFGTCGDEVRWTKKCNSLQELKDYYPDEIWDTLNALNKKTITIAGKEGS